VSNLAVILFAHVSEFIELGLSLPLVCVVITEHRNILIEDAVEMIARSFADYCRCRQTKQSSDSTVQSVSAAALSPSRASASAQSTPVTIPTLIAVAEHLQPDTVTRRLIGLLSADCELTHNELEHIISYLRLRQKALVSTSGRL